MVIALPCRYRRRKAVGVPSQLVRYVLNRDGLAAATKEAVAALGGCGFV